MYRAVCINFCVCLRLYSLHGFFQGFDHDAVVGRATFMKDIMKSILISNFMKIVNPVTEPVSRRHNAKSQDG